MSRWKQLVRQLVGQGQSLRRYGGEAKSRDVTTKLTTMADLVSTRH